MPAGASRGAAGAIELRDGDLARYRGLGCLRAVGTINDAINAAARAQPFAGQAELDAWLIGNGRHAEQGPAGRQTPRWRCRAFARACAAEQGLPLYAYAAAIGAGAVPALPRR